MKFYRSVGHIKAMSFDLDDTLYDNMPFIMEAESFLMKYIAEKYPQAANVSRQQWLSFKRQAMSENESLRHDMGALREVTLTKGFVFAELPSDSISSAVADCFDAFYQKRSDFSVDDSIIKTLKVLSKQYPLIAITNGNVNCEAIGIADYFTHILHAGPDGRMKPNADMFNKATVLSGIENQHILHVGDNLEKDVYGAINAGFQSAWVAADREMNLNRERMTVLPHIQLDSFGELEAYAK